MNQFSELQMFLLRTENLPPLFLEVVLPPELSRMPLNWENPGSKAHRGRGPGCKSSRRFFGGCALGRCSADEAWRKVTPPSLDEGAPGHLVT